MNRANREMIDRNFQVRELCGHGVFQIWADDELKSEHSSPVECEAAIRGLLGASREEAADLVDRVGSMRDPLALQPKLLAEEIRALMRREGPEANRQLTFLLRTHAWLFAKLLEEL